MKVVFGLFFRLRDRFRHPCCLQTACRHSVPASSSRMPHQIYRQFRFVSLPYAVMKIAKSVQPIQTRRTLSRQYVCCVANIPDALLLALVALLLALVALLRPEVIVVTSLLLSGFFVLFDQIFVTL